MNVDEIAEVYVRTMQNKRSVNVIVRYSVAELKKVNKLLKWEDIFNKYILLGILDDTQEVKTYCEGLTTYYGQLVALIEDIETRDLYFIKESDDTFDPNMQKMIAFIYFPCWASRPYSPGLGSYAGVIGSRS